MFTTKAEFDEFLLHTNRIALTPSPPSDEDEDFQHVTRPHQSSLINFTWFTPRLPAFHAHLGANAAHDSAVSPVLHIPDQYAGNVPNFTNPLTDGSATNASVSSNAVDLRQVFPSNTNPPHRVSY